MCVPCSRTKLSAVDKILNRKALLLNKIKINYGNTTQGKNKFLRQKITTGQGPVLDRWVQRAITEVLAFF